MVHACIYDNIPDRGGYGIHAKSAGFPDDYERDILSVSGCFSAGGGYEESVAIRYAPLRNEKYLLTLVLRHPVTYEEGPRAWHTEVHFLMDAQDADKLFRHPISAMAERVSCKAHELWLSMDCELNGELKLFGEQEHSGDNLNTTCEVDDCILLAGAIYCGKAGGARQLFLSSKDPWGELDMVQRWLPYALRKDLSFCIGLQNQQESRGTVFNFPTSVGLRQLYSAYGEGVPMSEKYWAWEQFRDQKLYNDCDMILSRMGEWRQSLIAMLFSVITKWSELRAFAKKDLREGLNELIIHTGQDVWCRHLWSKRYKSQDLIWLLDLLKSNKNTRDLRKEIKRQTKVAVIGKFSNPNPAQEAHKVDDDQANEALLKKTLHNHAVRGVTVVALAVALVAILTLFRQVLVRETMEIEQAIYYCISREAAVDTMKLIGAFLCGALFSWVFSELMKTYNRKK